MTNKNKGSLLECFPGIKKLNTRYPATYIYLLFRKEEIVYIGISRNILSRIREHRKEKSFSEVYFMETKRKDAPKLEAALIRQLRPPLNSQAFGRECEDRNILKKYKIWRKNG